MSFVQKYPEATQRSIWHVAVEKTRHLAHSVKRRRAERRHYDSVREVLEALPLATAEFARLSNHLANAERYLRSDEHGAAAYELNLLHGALRAQLALQGS